jgi:hypothetical protein
LNDENDLVAKYSRGITMKRSIYLLVLGILALALAPCASAQLERFSGYWKNVDPDTTGVTTLGIDASETDVAVHAWGKFYPADIDWEYANASYAYGPTADSDPLSEAVAISAVWTTSFSETLMIIRPVEEERLQADIYTRFTDGSGRTAYTQSCIFERGHQYQCYQDLPNPQLELTGTEDYSVSGSDFKRYKLSVTNENVYPPELFEAAPDLPPCGLNTESSRTWVDIYNQDDVRIYGFCALATSEDLKGLWFAVKQGEIPPDSVYIVMTDRRCDLSYVSNEVSIGSVSSIATPTTPPETQATMPPNLQTIINFQRVKPF